MEQLVFYAYIRRSRPVVRVKAGDFGRSGGAKEMSSRNKERLRSLGALGIEYAALAASPLRRLKELSARFNITENDRAETWTTSY